MKWLAGTLIVFFAFSAAAVDGGKLGPATVQHPDNKVEVINGKRFYSLQNVRRFNGSINNPKAQSVVHHPRLQTAGPAPVKRSPYQPGPPEAGAATTGTPMPKSASDQVLSVFAPEDKRLAPLPPATK